MQLSTANRTLVSVPQRANRLVVVSNRVSLPGTQNAGGLGISMLGALRRTGGLWLGWSGKVAAEPKTRRTRDESIHYVTRDLSPETFRDYYQGFANRTLWPLLHGRTDLMSYDAACLDAYLRVNADFADELVPLLGADDDIWIHDYHLIPLARLLRERGVKSRIGFFLHVPVPPPEILATLPRHREFLSALTAYDVLGLQTRGDVARLKQYFAEQMIAADSTHIACFPISIDTAAVAAAAQRATKTSPYEELRQSLGGRALLLGVDRLDYSKGLPHRFNAFGRLLEAHPHLRGQTTLVQIAPGSRTEIPEYRALGRKLEGIAGAINGRLADPTWTPIRYVNRGYSQDELVGFYRLARVGVVTPLRDGMNLVAKEYVASQDPNDPGVLVLSEFAGAADELRVGAVMVNPHDTDSCAEALRVALEMPLLERRRRWLAMMDVLNQHDIHAWTQSFVSALSAKPTVAEPRAPEEGRARWDRKPITVPQERPRLHALQWTVPAV